MRHRLPKRSRFFSHWLVRVSTASIFVLICLIFFYGGMTGVEGYGGYDDYDGGDPYDDTGAADRLDPGAYDHQDPEALDAMERKRYDDMERERYENNEEKEPKKKRFKLFEKRRYSYSKAKMFCQNREGQLAQDLNYNETERLQILANRGNNLTTNIWIGPNKQDSRRQPGRRPKRRPRFPEESMMMKSMSKCPSLSSATKYREPVLCHNKFTFICEFVDGKGITPVKAIKPKPRKKDEMRRKRGIANSFNGSEYAGKNQGPDVSVDDVNDLDKAEDVTTIDDIDEVEHLQEMEY